MRSVSQTHVPIDESNRVARAVADVRAHPLAPEPVQPLHLMLGGLASVGFHLYVQRVVAPPGYGYAQIGDAWLNALAFEVRSLALVPRSSVGYVVYADSLDVAVFDNRYLFLCFAHTHIMRRWSHVTQMGEYRQRKGDDGRHN